MPVTLQGVAIAFDGLLVLEGVTEEIHDGELTVLTGPSGTGKTSLMGVIAGVIPAASGTVNVNGQAPSPEQVVWVPQGANALPARTVIDNVMIAPLSDGFEEVSAAERAMTALEQVGLAGRAHTQAWKLSGGQLQRLALARALASMRPLLLADEPTANLDAGTAREMIALLRTLRFTQTLMVATHDPALMLAADRVIDLRRYVPRMAQESSDGTEA